MNIPDSIIILFWIGTRISALVILFLMIMWAVYNKQFSRMDRGRYLALDRSDNQNRKE